MGWGLGRGCALPSWGSGGLPPETKINFALKIMQFWASFGTSFLYYSIKWGLSPVLKVGDLSPLVPPLLRRLWFAVSLWRRRWCQIQSNGWQHRKTVSVITPVIKGREWGNHAYMTFSHYALSSFSGATRVADRWPWAPARGEQGGQAPTLEKNQGGHGPPWKF